ncbi:MAG TPA: VTT domain-containing protein [Candidatus Coprosoma intestinipullorum]|uniref:VTT domain-containing protein n=1 Tax=Candidatus Coprosoma intestinipullorum TaxID=2840752 RepID=A0A9D0ZRP4_9FIRM|nr:VTT domain-containing protein [Candidatus Coprosoma intestinipullorum]
MEIIDFILHINEYIGTFINEYGNFIYVILFLIIFCETGLVFLPFLPGDSLIFAAGAFAAIGELNIFLLWILIVIAAILGDTVNYEIGKHFGKKILNNKKITIIKKENLQKAEDLVAKYGGAAVFIARFMPIIRTIVPFVVGIGQLHYPKFIKFNALGGIIWVTLFIIIGYLFGNIPAVKDHFTLIILAIIFLSLLPIIIAFIKNKLKK